MHYNLNISLPNVKGNDIFFSIKIKLFELVIVALTVCVHIPITIGVLEANDVNILEADDAVFYKI